MKLTTIGKGTIGGTLGRLWTAAGHEVTELGRDGGDAAGADVVLLAVPSSVVADALAGVSGLGGQVIIDATNRLGGEAPTTGYASVTEYVKAATNGPVAKAFNLNFGKLFEQAAAASTRPDNIWVGDEGARAAVAQPRYRDGTRERRSAGVRSNPGSVRQDARGDRQRRR